jgi:phosphonopyruvate decarboxylase
MGIKMGDLLKLLDIPYIVLTENGFERGLQEILKIIAKSKRPAALILKKGLVEEEMPLALESNYGITRSRAVEAIMNAGHNKAYFITTNGLISRELFYQLSKKGIEEINSPFYMLGSMGHALAIALGFARYAPKNKKVIVLDGDGGCLMHLGSMASVGKDRPRGLVHVVLDNQSYASTGGQPTLSKNIDFCKVAEGCNYKNIHSFKDEHKLKRALPGIMEKPGPTLIHILINNIREESRPRISKSYSCERIKERFINLISQREGMA